MNFDIQNIDLCKVFEYVINTGKNNWIMRFQISFIKADY